MKTIKSACKLQDKALDINVGDQIERLDEIIRNQNGRDYFDKTFLTEGMKSLVSRGIARLAGKSNDSIFHLKQAMGGGKTHVMVAFALLAKDPDLREAICGMFPYQDSFKSARIAAFNGRNHPSDLFWGEIARQLGKGDIIAKALGVGANAPDETVWLEIFSDDQPILILLDEMPPYFHYYNTQQAASGTYADIITCGFANMLTAAQKKSNVCIVVSDLDAAYSTGAGRIQSALNDAAQELGRAAVSLTPVNLESNEIYYILRKRLFSSLPSDDEVADIANEYETSLQDAIAAGSIERSSESLAHEIESTYPFHPSFKNIVALFKENENFKQTRGLMELVSRLLKSVWNSDEDIYLIGAQHFDLNLPEVREKIAEISEMRDVIAKDLWDENDNAHAQLLDVGNRFPYARQIATLILLSSLSTAVNAVKGLNKSEILQYLIAPHHKASEFASVLEDLLRSAWYLHNTKEGRFYFDKQENLIKRLESYAEKAPKNKIDELINLTLKDLFKSTSKVAYNEVLPLPLLDNAVAHVKKERILLIMEPDGNMPPKNVERLFNEVLEKNNILVLTGNKSTMTDLDKKARQVYAATKAKPEVENNNQQLQELEEKETHFKQDLISTVVNIFDRVIYPATQLGTQTPTLRNKPLDNQFDQNQPYEGERQVIKTLTSDPLKLYTNVKDNYDALKAKAEGVLFGQRNECRRSELRDKMSQQTSMPWMPKNGLDDLILLACQRGVWEDLGNNMISKSPKPKQTEVSVNTPNEPNDEGFVTLTVSAINAGSAPCVYYAEDGEVSTKSSVLTGDQLRTNALYVQFLAVDPTGKCKTGDPKTWKNKLVIKNKLIEMTDTRHVELFVVPRGEIKYTLDSSEPRNGIPYTTPIEIGNGKCTIDVFAECEGMVQKNHFTFNERGNSGLELQNDKPATWESSKYTTLSGTAEVHSALKMASSIGISLGQVKMIVGIDENIMDINIYKKDIDVEFVRNTLETTQEFMGASAPVIFKFQQLYAHTGHDLKRFLDECGISIENGSVSQ